MLMQRPPFKERMSVLQYSPHPAEFYTFKHQDQKVGLGAGPCATDPGLWNIVYLAIAQVDEHEAENPDAKKFGIWTPDFLKPYTDTAAYELSGTAIGDLATMMHATGFAQYLMTHPNAKLIPLAVKYGIGILVTMRNRAAKAVNIRSGEVVQPSGVIVHEPADVNRAKITSMGDWAAKLEKGALH